MLDASCFICDRHIFDAEDLVEHFKNWHHAETRGTSIYVLAGKCIEGLREALEEDEEPEGQDSEDYDLGKHTKSGGNTFGGFSGGSFSGGGAKSSW